MEMVDETPSSMCQIDYYVSVVCIGSFFMRANIFPFRRLNLKITINVTIDMAKNV